MNFTYLGKAIVILGMVLVIVGGLMWLLARTGLPLGRLPGDIHIEGERASCIVPIASMIILSIILTVVLNIVVRLLNR